MSRACQALNLARRTANIHRCTRALFFGPRTANLLLIPPRVFSPYNTACFSTEAAEATFHNIVCDNERPLGKRDKREFQAETRVLLDIVARSLYSEKEVFLRELISNASDALEKLRYSMLVKEEDSKERVASQPALEIHLATDKMASLLTIQDTGVGMTRDELVSNLGTIAHSGTKKFVEEMKRSLTSSNTIGQFGVGFYSVFMVATHVELYTRSSKGDSPGLRWTSDGTGSYEIEEAEGVQQGTKIVLHLRTECREYADEGRIKSVIKKYSNFVTFPIYVNGTRVNDIQPLWTLDPKDVSKEQYSEFYHVIANTFDKPRFVLHYTTDMPLCIKALLYFPRSKPGLINSARDNDFGLSLYSRKVLIQANMENFLPRWLRFIQGVIDSEDIPLNLSRELLQNSALIKRISNIITNRILRFLQERANKEPEEYTAFYKDYGFYLQSGVVSSNTQSERESIAKLLRFESSKTTPGRRISLEDYTKNLGDRKKIYYLAASNRQLAESSPYYENLKKRDIEVIFCYEPHDELVLMYLDTFQGKHVISVEKEMRQESEADRDPLSYGADSLTRPQLDELLPWIQSQLMGKATNVKVTTRLDAHACVVTVEEMAAARHVIRTKSQHLPGASVYASMKPQLEINPKHELIKKLNKLRTENPALAELLIQQLFANAMIEAGLTEDPRTLLTTINKLLVMVLRNH